MKLEMFNRRVWKNALSCVVAVLCLLIFGAGFWAAIVRPQTGPAPRWRPRRVPADARFVGDQACAECHGKLVAVQSRSAMGMAMEPVANSKVLTDHPIMTFRGDTYSYEIRRKDKESFYTVTDGKDSVTLPILYAFGQGKAGQTYVLQHEGAYYESRLSFYNEIKGLDFTIGAPRAVPESLKKAIGRRLSENEVNSCFSCHSTGGVNGGHLDLEKMTPGVRCEACHGPGGAHIEAVNAEKPGAKLIYNPNRLSSDELTQNFCASCHRGSEEFGLLKGMEINNVRFQPYRIFHSKCYSDDRRISCTACHNPHEPLKVDSAHYDSKCLACHAPKNSLTESKTEPGAHGMVAGCKVATKECVSCHMPKLGPAAAHFKFTDHYIRTVKPKEVYPN